MARRINRVKEDSVVTEKRMVGGDYCPSLLKVFIKKGFLEGKISFGLKGTSSLLGKDWFRGALK